MSLFSVAKRNKDFGMGIIERQYETGWGGGGVGVAHKLTVKHQNKYSLRKYVISAYAYKTQFAQRSVEK